VRRVTRNTIFAIVVVIGLLLALGAVPSLLRSGEPYHVTAEQTTEQGPSVSLTALPASRYPFVSAAIADGRSEAYYEGPFGFKEGFAHSPFDEFDAITQRYGTAVGPDDRLIYVGTNESRYRVRIDRAGA
jgi:hypothetical protein